MLIAALLGWVALGGQVVTAGVAPTGCPAKRAAEEGGTYGRRARNYCEVRWTVLLAALQTGGLTHDEHIDVCLHRCVSERAATSGAPLGAILGGIGAAALAAGVAASGGGGSGSDPPPASP